MTLIDALAALQEGAVPTNEQTIAFIQRIKTSLPVKDDLSKPGNKLVKELESFLESIRLLIDEKNEGEYIQEFLWRTKGTAGQLGKNGLKFRWGKGAKDSSNDGSEKGKGLKTKAIEAGKVVKDDSIQGKCVLSMHTFTPEMKILTVLPIFFTTSRKTSQDTSQTITHST